MNKIDLRIMERLAAVVNKCEGKVELIIGDSIRLNLKSTLCQFVSMMYLLEDKNLPDIRIHTACGADSDQMVRVILGH